MDKSSTDMFRALKYIHRSGIARSHGQLYEDPPDFSTAAQDQFGTLDAEVSKW